MHTADYTFEDIRLVKEIIGRDPQSQLLASLREVYKDAKDILGKQISKVFDQYTVHDIGHSFRIMEYMYDLINDIKQLDELEIIILCYSALLHDIGMAVTDDEIIQIKSNEYKKEGLTYSSFLKVFQGDHTLALQDFVRRFHAKRSYDYIESNLKSKLRIPNHNTLSIWKDIALICQSHNESFDWITRNLTSKEIRGKERFNPRYCAYLLRLADILDIDDNRTPFSLYKFINPTGRSDSEWLQHYSVYNYDKINVDNLGRKTISFFGHCDNPKIHRKLLEYFDWVSVEIKGCVKESALMEEKYRLNIYENILIEIKPEGYTFSDSKINVDFKAVTNLLTGEKIYGDKKYGLRELIQNGIDACRIRIEEEKNLVTYDSLYSPVVSVIINEQQNTVTIKDNGIGMNVNIINRHFLSVGSSYYKSYDFKLKNYSFNPIGNFGIGFLACFMLSPYVRVITRHISSSKKYEIDIEEHSEYTSINEVEDLNFKGTEIILQYNDFVKVFSKNVLIEVKRFLETNFIDNEISIQVVDLDIKYKCTVFNNILSPFVLKSSQLIYGKKDAYVYKEIIRSNVDLEGNVSYKTFYCNVFNKLNDVFQYALRSWKRNIKITNIYYLNENSILQEVDALTEISNYLEYDRLNFFTLVSGEKLVNKSIINTNSGDEFSYNNVVDEPVSIVIYKVEFLSDVLANSLLNLTSQPTSSINTPIYDVKSMFTYKFRDHLRYTKLHYELVIFSSICLFKSKKTGMYMPYIGKRFELIYELDTRTFMPKRNVVSPISKNYDESYDEQSLISNSNLLKILLLHTDMERNYRNLSSESKGNFLKGSVFLKNVYVKNAELKPYLFTGYYYIRTFKINIFGDDITTNVSRDNFDKLSFYIANAKYYNEMNFQVINSLPITDIEKSVIIEFFENYNYGELIGM